MRLADSEGFLQVLDRRECADHGYGGCAKGCFPREVHHGFGGGHTHRRAFAFAL